MEIEYYQINAFTEDRFGGNPAGVCVLDEWLSDETLQLIAKENDLAETAFFIKAGDHYKLRWFTPKLEVDLCGHATLAAAFVIFNYLEKQADYVKFKSLSGELVVKRDGELLAMDFPAWEPELCDTSRELLEGLKTEPEAVLRNKRDVLVVYESQEIIESIEPDFEKLKEVDCLGVIVTSPGREVDFVSRFFAPNAGIDEDPVTGSAHCTLIPYWAKRLGKQKLHALQLSTRGGELFCEDHGERVSIAGSAVVYLKGVINI